MQITKRELRNARATFFAPSGERIYTAGDYVCGYAIPSLERLFRFRGHIAADRVAIRPIGDSLVLAYQDGLIDVRDGATGATRMTMHLGFSISHCAVSPCGRFAVVSKDPGGIGVFELQTSKEIWKQPTPAKRVEWLGNGEGFAVITSESKVETWTWPPGESPRSTIQISRSIFRPTLNGTWLVTDSYPEISVIDLAKDKQRFSVPYEAISVPFLLRDGSLFVTRKRDCELYSADGSLLYKVSAPTLSGYGHAFSPLSDDAVLCYFHGIVFVQDFISWMASHNELPIPFLPKPGKPATSICTRIDPEEPDEQTTIEATTPEEMTDALQSFSKPAWIPTLVEERSGPTSSKFGGVPWLSSDEEWPRCGQCDSYMDLFLQLNSAELPADARELFEGLLQVFACTYETSHEGVCESYETFSNAALVRICRPSGTGAVSVLPDPELYEELHIVGWAKALDFPNCEELRTLGVSLSDEQYDMQLDDSFDFPITGDKLLGWPAWQQNVERHACPVCDQPMRPIFQIDALKGIPALFGDGGRGWIVQCPEHRDTVAFHWASG